MVMNKTNNKSSRNCSNKKTSSKATKQAKNSNNEG